MTFQQFKKYYNFDHCLHPLVAPCTMFAPIYEYPSIKVDNLFVLSGYDFSNHNTPYYAFGTIEKFLISKGAQRFFL